MNKSVLSIIEASHAKREAKIQSRSWQLIVPAGWDNLEPIKERCRGISRNYYFILHSYDKNELGEPVGPHWHLLMAFAAARRLNSMQNYFKEWGKFDEPGNEKEEGEFSGEEPKPGNLEGAQLLRSNSFERVYSLIGAKKYLVHSEDPNKYQYSPLDVETNDKLYINLFLPQTDEITATRNIIRNFKQLSVCDTFDEFLLLFEEAMYKMTNNYRISNVVMLRRYYNEYKNASGLCYRDDGFDKVPPKDDGFFPVDVNINVGDLPF